MALVAFRVAIQLVHPVSLGLAAAGTVIALTALTLLLAAVRREGGEAGGLRYVFGVIAGLTLDTALRAGYRSWDPAWQDGPRVLLLAVLLGALALLLLFAGVARSLQASGERGTKPVGCIYWVTACDQQVLFCSKRAGPTTTEPCPE